jgi:hypothetical protein
MLVGIYSMKDDSGSDDFTMFCWVDYEGIIKTINPIDVRENSYSLDERKEKPICKMESD